MKEEERFQQRIIELARYKGFDSIYHTHDSRHSPAGFPDLLLLKDQRMIVAELKAGKNNLSAEQYFWLLAFTEITEDVYVWWDNDDDWNEILEVIRN